jgi:hypothetical protein
MSSSSRIGRPHTAKPLKRTSPRRESSTSSSKRVLAVAFTNVSSQSLSEALRSIFVNSSVEPSGSPWIVAEGDLDLAPLV